MNEVHVLLTNLTLLMARILLLWLIVISLRDASFIGSFWAAGFIFVVASTYMMSDWRGQRGRSDYEDYCKRIGSFFPWPPTITKIGQDWLIRTYVRVLPLN